LNELSQVSVKHVLKTKDDTFSLTFLVDVDVGLKEVE
jgi:hypothetical protein